MTPREYGQAHRKVAKHRGTPSKCEECRTTTAAKFEWANLTGDYFNVNDYIRLCTSCHHKFDGISNGPKGETHHSAKLTEAKVKEIRKSTKNSYSLSAEYGVSQSTISRIKNKLIWKDV